jgi:hypothetical protein
LVVSLVPGGVFIVGAYHAVNGAIDIHDNGLGWGNALEVAGGAAMMAGPLKTALGKFRRARASLRAQSGCFVAGTLVLLSNGTLMPIESLGVGDRVMVAGGECQEVETGSVLALHEFVAEELLVLDLGDVVEPLTVTAEHPIWVSDRGWTPAREIRAGDCLVTVDGVPLEVLGITVQDTLEPVYNLTVGGTNTYFVTSGGLLVHNKPLQFGYVPGPGGFAQVFNTAEDAIGLPALGGIRRVGSGATKNADIIAEGFTRTYYYVDEFGDQWTVFYNPTWGKYAGAHWSSSNLR